MATQSSSPTGPDLTEGVTLADFAGGQMLRGHVGKKSVLLVRLGDEVLAVGAKCTHYQGPLDQGIVVGETLRCPLHHACFSLRTGEALAAPAFDPLPCWQVEHENGRIRVRERLPAATPAPIKAPPDQPQDIVILGGGAAGFAAAEMLRRRGYPGRLTILGAEVDPPCDRPNLSKDFLAGTAPESWMPLKPADFYKEQSIGLRLGVTVTAIDTAARELSLADGSRIGFDRLLIATGAEPVRLPIPGADLPHVFTLRSFADSRAIGAMAAQARSAVVLGSGFIGLEAAAALRARGLGVHVVSRDERPLEKVLGSELGDFIRHLHEEHGVTFHMQDSITAITPDRVTLATGASIDADLVIIGIGVRPRTALAEAAGLDTDHGILVDARLETSCPGIFAAGDVARWPGGPGGAGMRVEHWVVAERQGQVAAQNMLGAGQPFRDATFFWSRHYDVSIRYVGHAAGWDDSRIEGDIAARNATVSYLKDGQVLAVATIGRDRVALEQGQRLSGGRQDGR